MQKCLRGLTAECCLIYLDDILCIGRDAQDLLAKVSQVFDRFRAAKLRMRPAKCRWSLARVKFLGHFLDANGVSLDREKVKIVEQFPVLTTPIWRVIIEDL